MAQSNKRKLREEEEENEHSDEHFTATASMLFKRRRMDEAGLEDETGDREPLTLNVLPDEILDYIFSFLPTPERISNEIVCRRWRWLGQHLSWQRPKTLIFAVMCCCGYPAQGYDHVINAILSRCGLNLQKLTVCRKAFAPWHSKKTLGIVGKHCPNLSELTLINVPLDTQCLKVFSQVCTNLKFLKLGKYGEIYEDDLLTIFKGCRSLECLRVSICFNYVTGECFNEVNTNLKALSLLKCFHLKEVAFEHLTTRCNLIKDLRLSYCRKIEEESLFKTLRHYKDTLKILYLDRWDLEVHWNRIIPDLHFLEQLSLSCCYPIDNNFCRNLVDNCPSLNSLYIRETQVTDPGLSHLASLPSLTTLDVSGLSISGPGIQVLASKGILEKVYATDCFELSAPSDHWFVSLAQHCPNLHILDVSNNEDVTDNLIDACRNALNSGTLKGPLKIAAVGTEVTEEVQQDNLEVFVTDNMSSLRLDDNEFDYVDRSEMISMWDLIEE